MELHAVADPGQLIRPGGDLERPVQPFELEALAVVAPVEAGDRLHLGERADMEAEQEYVTGETGDEGGEQADDQVASVARRQRVGRGEGQERRTDGRVSEQPSDLGPGPPRDHQGHDRRQDHQVRDREVDEVRSAEGDSQDAAQDHEAHPVGDRLWSPAQAAAEREPRGDRDEPEEAVQHDDVRARSRMEDRQGQGQHEGGYGNDHHRRPGRLEGPEALTSQEPPAPADRVVVLRLDELGQAREPRPDRATVDDHGVIVSGCPGSDYHPM